MPNWCYNSLTIEGSAEDISAIKKQLNQPFQRQHDQWNMETKQMELVDTLYPNPVFAFWNIIKPTNLEAYNKQADHSLPMQEQLAFSGDNWYDWNVRNWGTKWDVAVSWNDEYPETELMEEDENNLAYRFNTAWSPPTPAIQKLSEQYPNCLFNLSFEEETGWGGEYEYTAGEGEELENYGWKCRECDHTEDETPYCETCEFDMCPECGYGEPMDQDRAECEEHREPTTVN
jgi:hypothetical protein